VTALSLGRGLKIVMGLGSLYNKDKSIRGS